MFVNNKSPKNGIYYLVLGKSCYHELRNVMYRSKVEVTGTTQVRKKGERKRMVIMY